MWQLIHNNRVVKEFPTQEQCMTEAKERGWVVMTGYDEIFNRSPRIHLVNGVQIQRVDSPTKPELRNV